MAYTNTGLVTYCNNALKEKTKYMWGGIMRPITTSYISILAKMYPTQYTTDRKKELDQLIGKGYYGCDCVGLIKSYYWGGIGSKNYKASTDYNCQTMYNAAKVKGSMSAFPMVPGQLVFLRNFSHVGVYIGGGYVIECTLGSFGDGVIKTKLSARNWAYWCECPVIEYSSNVAFKVGDKVKVSTACKSTYDGKSISAKYVCNNKTVFTIIQINDDRVVIGINGAVTAAVNSKYLTKA